MIRSVLSVRLLSRRCKILKTFSPTGQRKWVSTLRRSMLYLSLNRLNNIRTELAVDCIVLDCKDEETEHEKINQRHSIYEFLNNSDLCHSKTEWCVKVNPVQTPDLCEADLGAVLSAKNLPNSICLPNIYNTDQLQWFTEKIWNNLIKRPENSQGPLKLLMLVESSRGMLNLIEICKKAEELATMAPVVPVGLVLGGFELMADLGVSKTLSGLELLYIREKFVLVAKGFGLQAIDMKFDKSNKNLFREKCEEGVMIGFTGKQVINLSEAVIAQEVFVPSRSKVSWAKNTLRKYYKRKDTGELNFENAEVDEATFRRAQHTLKVAIAVGKIKEEMEAVLKEGE